MVNHFTKTIHHHQHFFHHHHFFLLESPSACRESKLFLTLPGNNVNNTLPFQKRTVGRRKKSSRMSFLDFKWLNFFKTIKSSKGDLGGHGHVWSNLSKKGSVPLFVFPSEQKKSTRSIPLITYRDKRNKMIPQHDGLRVIQKCKQHTILVENALIFHSRLFQTPIKPPDNLTAQLPHPQCASWFLFFDDYMHVKKAMKFTKSCRRHCWWKNSAMWLAESNTKIKQVFKTNFKWNK